MSNVKTVILSPPLKAHLNDEGKAFWVKQAALGVQEHCICDQVAHSLFDILCWFCLHHGRLKNIPKGTSWRTT